MFEKPPQNSLEENGASIEIPKSEEVIINPVKIISQLEAPLIREDDKINAAREKISTIFSKEAPKGSENDADRERREELELDARNLFAKMSTENPARRPTEKVDAFYSSEKIFDGLKPITKETFQIEEMPGMTFSEEVYHTKSEVRARVAIINDKGEKLYIDNLLPASVRMVSADLDILSDEVSREVAASKIEAHKMANASRGSFAYSSGWPGGRRVQYGNLKNKEGMTALFHEIGHAWSDEAGLAGTESGDKNRDTFWNRTRDKFFGTNAVQKNALENKISEERDAWAHAFRAMRFLKNEGFPLLVSENSGALKKRAEHCLSTYEESRAEQIAKLRPRHRFVSGAKESPAEIVERQNLEREARELLERELNDL